MRLRQTLKQYPELGLCTIAMVLLGVLGAALVLYFAGQQQAQQLERYGQALADRAAVQAVEPALAHDMISLQAIVHSLTAHPAVLRASIHDVENRLLVENGASTAPLGNLSPSFSAGITLDTHIAGHLSVTLNAPPASQLYGLFLWVWSLAILLCITGLWLTHRLLQHRRLRAAEPIANASHTEAASGSESGAPETETETQADIERSDEDLTEPTITDEPLAQEAADPISDTDPEATVLAPPTEPLPVTAAEPDARDASDVEEDEAPHQVIIELAFINIETLRLQLSLGRFNERLARLEQILGGILALYDGTKEPLRKQRMRLTVTGDSLADASFYALCVCQLALRLSLSGERPVLKLAANVMAPATQADPQIEPPSHTAPAVWVDPALQCDELAQHVEINSDDQLEQIKPPYDALLLRQEQQLANLNTDNR
ncbi:hypothetical protein [Gilvimarinus agarilyticus]|uniref:hypothetical protein n=1 Tax=Gilvimarinus agarilyticus TaxID=679259 RepID=UPI0005A1ACA4|nr:hypothetical protein [Gilvimarinus agarilyticus]